MFRRKRVKTPTLARAALTLVAAFAFFVQSFITQTHIHIISPSGAAKTIVANAVAHHDKSHDPFGNDDSANCPVCQQVAQFGAYTTPTFALLVEPARHAAHIVAANETRPPDFILSHAWRSRAPPTA